MKKIKSIKQLPDQPLFSDDAARQLEELVDNSTEVEVYREEGKLLEDLRERLETEGPRRYPIPLDSPTLEEAWQQGYQACLKNFDLYLSELLETPVVFKGKVNKS